MTYPLTLPPPFLASPLFTKKGLTPLRFVEGVSLFLPLLQWFIVQQNLGQISRKKGAG